MKDKLTPIIVVLVCVALGIGLIILLVKMIIGLFHYLGESFHAAKTYAFKPGADEVYEYLKDHAMNGDVTEEVMDEAVAFLLSKGNSVDDVVDNHFQLYIFDQCGYQQDPRFDNKISRLSSYRSI